MRENGVSWNIMSNNIDEAEAILRVNLEKTHIDVVQVVLLSGGAEGNAKVIRAQAIDLTPKLAARLLKRAESLTNLVPQAAATRLSGKSTCCARASCAIPGNPQSPHPDRNPPSTVQTLALELQEVFAQMTTRILNRALVFAVATKQESL
jgi:hypothetical protein